ncbi:MAG: hypothetical protein JSV52_14420 [Candidatus Zixiibacteriota bacterium]|nr:MAG: hypothetical protein JSV52_14420 [candidate division Zixibacteria bacterium]
MKNAAHTLLTIVVLLITAKVNAAETNIGGNLFAHWMMDLSDEADSFNEFALERAYVDIKSTLSDYTSVRLTTDLRSADVDGSEVYNIIIKYAHVDWRPAFANGIITLRLGIQPTHYIDMMNKLWGRRYLAKTVSDDRKFLTSSDIGAGVVFRLGEKSKTGYVAANIWNGTSYSDIEEMNKQKDFSGFFYLTPLADDPDFKLTAMQAQVYLGTQNEELGMLLLDDGDTEVQLEASDYDRRLFSLGGLLAYRNSFDVGADINFYKAGQGRSSVDGEVLDDISSSGYSFFGALYLEPLVAADSPFRTLDLFGRMDVYDPDTDNEDDGETLVIVGIECAPIKGFKASVNLRGTSFQNDSDSRTELYLNTLFKF